MKWIPAYMKSESLPKIIIKFKKISLYSYLSILSSIVFTLVWSYFLILRMNTFNIGIFDYGVAYNLLWKEAFLVPGYPSSVGYLPFYVPGKLITFVLVPYMWLFPSIYNLLILQVVVYAISGIGLYLLAKDIIKDSKVAFLIEIIWMLYYPNSSALSYPFHYMALFPLFYIFGFYFLVKNKLLFSTLFFSLSAITQLLQPIIVIFSIPAIIYIYKKFAINNGTIRKNKGFIASLIFLFAFSISVLIFVLLVSGSTVYTSQVTSTGVNVAIWSQIMQRLTSIRGTSGAIYVLFMILPIFPVAFAILFDYRLFDYRFTLAALPAILYYWVGNYRIMLFYYPVQYSALLAPVLFTSFIFLIYQLQNKEQIINSPKIPGRRIFKISSKSKVKTVLFVVIIINIILFSIYSPIGPLNEFMRTDFNNNPPANGGYGWFNNLTVSNYDQNLLRMIDLIPPNATVLASFDMPQVANRYYFTYPGQYNPSTPIDYAINNPRSPFFLVTVDDTGPDFYNYNMMQLSNMMLLNSSYGVYAQSEGAILFKYKYSGEPKMFIPINESIKLTENGNDIFSSSTILISPGMYNISVQGNLKSGSLYMGSILLFNLPENNVKLYISLYMFETFTIRDSTAGGSMQNLSIYLKQVSPARCLNLSKSIAAPSIAHKFIANYSYFSPVVIPYISLNENSFSYMYMINLTTYEDGKTTPENISNDEVVFALIGNDLYIWNQIENTGYFEFGFRTQNGLLNAYIKPFVIPTKTWLYIAVTYNNGEVSLFVDGYLVYSQIFPPNTPVGSVSYGMIGGLHPFLQNNGTIFPNTNPLNASISNFVIYNGTLSLEEIQNPQILLQNITSDNNVVYYNWINPTYYLNYSS